jgi:hypothetical protein
VRCFMPRLRCTRARALPVWANPREWSGSRASQLPVVRLVP